MAKLLEATPVVYVDCGICTWCKKTTWICIPLYAWNKYNQDMGRTHIQWLLPELSLGTRESLISGVHSDCFDKMFGSDEEPAEWPDDGLFPEDD